MPSLAYDPFISSLLHTGTQQSDGISSVSNGRITPSFDLQGVAKGGKTGKYNREKGAVEYCAAENIALLTYITAVPDSFNTYESSVTKMPW
jgi:hypothetical protein